VSTDVTRYSMELLGGIGFLEEFPLAKLHRDALVTSIWEGMSNIQSLDMAEDLFRKDAGRAYMEEVSTEISKIGDQGLGRSSPPRLPSSGTRLPTL